MNGGRWGLEGPPLEAYSRVTNPERFEPLHPAALAHLERLQQRYAVERVEGNGLDPELEQMSLARPTVKLIPADANAAPIVVAFTTYPGIVMRCGHLLVMAFPGCGCDACDETADGELQRLTETLDDVVGGRFRESIRIPLFGHAEQQWQLYSATHSGGGGAFLPRSRARALAKKLGREFEWSPWPVR